MFKSYEFCAFFPALLHYIFLEFRDYYETAYTDAIDTIRESVGGIFLGTTDDEIGSMVRQHIGLFSALKNNLFFIARVHLRAAQQVTNETRLNHVDDLGAVFVAKRMKFLGLLRERLSIVLSPETVELFFDPNVCFKNPELALLSLAMANHPVLGRESDLNLLNEECLRVVFDYLFPVGADFPAPSARGASIFNANKYCDFVLAFNVQQDGNRLDRWMARRQVTFSRFDEVFHGSMVDSALQESARSSSPVASREAPTGVGSEHSTPDSEYSPASSGRLATAASHGFLRRSLF